MIALPIQDQIMIFLFRCLSRNFVGILMALVLSTSFQAYPGNRGDLKGQQCCICINKFGKKSKIVSHEKTIYHIFHQSCLENWAKVKPECPLCKKEITKIVNRHFEPKENNNDVLRNALIQSSVKAMVCIYVTIAIYSFINGLKIDSCEIQEAPFSCDFLRSLKQLIMGTHSIVVIAAFTEIIHQRFIR